MRTLAQLALSRPTLLAQHARGYAALIAVEAQAWATQARLHTMVACCMLLLFSASLTLAGVSVMLWPLYASGPHDQALPLLCAPALPMLGALMAWWWLHEHPQTNAFLALQQQFELDMACLAEVADGQT